MNSQQQHFFTPAPGLSFQLQGSQAATSSRDDFAPSAWSSLNASFFELSSAPSARPPLGPHWTTTQPQSQPQSRKSSASSACSSVDSNGLTAPSASSSLASSFVDESPLLKRVVASGEDPALAAARRALWDDDPVEPEPEQQPQEEAQEDEVEACDSEDEDFDPSESVALRNARLFELPLDPAPHSPCHTRTHPLSSCLRLTSSASSTADSSPSLSCSSYASGFNSPRSPSSTASSFSVQFSDSPPTTFLTYSKVDYERRGEPTVEKLTVREFIELREVKTAVGLWSGNVAKWDAQMEEITLDTQLANLACAQQEQEQQEVIAVSMPAPGLTLCEKRGTKAAHLVLDSVQAMDDATQLTLKPHFSPTVTPAPTTEP